MTVMAPTAITGTSDRDSNQDRGLGSARWVYGLIRGRAPDGRLSGCDSILGHATGRDGGGAVADAEGERVGGPRAEVGHVLED